MSNPPDTAKRPINLEPSWLAVLEDEFDKPYMKNLRAFLGEESRKQRIFPPGNEIFNAFTLTPFDAVKVVVLGQDPYHGPGQAHGLSFSVREGVRPPPSLENIFKELHDDLGLPRPPHGSLTKWAKQGVLLLNTVLTVRARQANSHREKGWEIFTDEVIRRVNAQRDGLVFLLWGSAAKKKSTMIDTSRHLILTSSHPSPYSASYSFFGSKPFSKINQYLEKNNKTPIDWSLD